MNRYSPAINLIVCVRDGDVDKWSILIGHVAQYSSMYIHHCLCDGVKVLMIEEKGVILAAS